MQQHGRVGGKVAIVTGVAQGLGEGIKRVLAEHGAQVVVATVMQFDPG